MKIEIELGFSHIRDSIVMIDRALARYPNDGEAISLTHLRNALFEALPVELRELVKPIKTRKRAEKIDYSAFAPLGAACRELAAEVSAKMKAKQKP